MSELYQDPNPISSTKTQKLLHNPFARTKHGSKSTAAAVPADSAATTHPNPFADDVTLVNQKLSHDPDAEFDSASEGWKFKLKNRKASAPATDVGEYARATTVHERGSFAELMEKTKGMTPEQVADVLKTRERVDGEKIMNGRKGYGYQMMAGAFSGTM